MSDELAPEERGEFALDQQTAEQMKAQTASGRAELTRRRMAMEAQMESARADMEAQQKALRERFDKQMADLNAQMAPMRAELKRLEEMSWTVDLYMGRNEYVELIKDGKPASAETPITIRQMVLAADEESLVLAEEDRFDHRHMDSFIEWLCASNENRDRIIPDERGVVVVVPTFKDRNYKNQFENMARGDANRTAHWIIRNGERLYLMMTDDSLNVSQRLLPKRDEFTKFFHGFNGKPLSPGSAEWIRAEESADATRKHYMRLMLVLQGIIDRTVAFHPLPEGGVNLMSMSAQDSGAVRLIAEGDMVLTDGRPTFRQWQKGLLSQMRIGVRLTSSPP